MSTRKSFLSASHRGVALAAIAALTITMAEPPLAAASPMGAVAKDGSATAGSSRATDISAARRRVRHYRRGGSAAGLAFMGLAFGAIGAFAAQQRRDDYYDNGYGGGYGYGYAPGYYGGGPYYGRRYYRNY